jgi:geranylgeranyl reductase
MHSFSVIIIGAGPGGLACATLLAEKGLDVLVLEKNAVPGPKVCGGGITWRGLIQRVPESLIDRAFPAQHIRSTLQETVLQSDSPMVATVRREHLGEWMHEQARAAGAVVRTSCRVGKITPNSVETSQGTFGYRQLVGADGSRSLVRRYLGIPTEKLGLGIHFRVPGQFEKMEWHLNDTLFGNGYAWIFPFRDMASVGVYGAIPGNSPQRMLQNLKRWAAARNISLNNLKPQGGLINFDYRGWHFGNIMLIGDAAGLASGLTGEGMYQALVSGETAARAFLDPDCDCSELERLIAKQKKHLRVAALSATNRIVNIATMEILLLALRAGIIPFSMLEMAD